MEVTLYTHIKENVCISVMMFCAEYQKITGKTLNNYVMFYNTVS